MWNKLFAPKDNTIHVVFGISSTGKSTFIVRARKNGLLPCNAKILTASEIGRSLPQGSCIIHYNLLRPYNNCLDNINNSIDSDPILSIILNASSRIKPYFLMTHKTILLRRVLNRDCVEPVIKNGRDKYPVIDIFELLCHIDYTDFHQHWVSYLSQYFPKN